MSATNIALRSLVLPHIAGQNSVGRDYKDLGSLGSVILDLHTYTILSKV